MTGDADITFDDNEPGASGGPTEGVGSEIRKSHVNVSVDWLEEHGATIDSDSFRTYIHEIGHALGLGHPGDYPRDGQDAADVTYEADAKFANDSWQATLMSYFDQVENTYVDASYAVPVTPMIVDIIAVQNLYGFAVINPGDTVYGYESNVGGYLGQLFAALSGEEPDADVYADGPVALTIFDSGGHDLLDLRWDDDDQRVDLSPEGISDVFGLAGNLSIARGTIIENFVAGSGDDAVTGNDANRASCETRDRPSFPCRRRRGEGRSAGGMQHSQDGSDRAREAGDTEVHGACLPVMRASAREERWRISFTSRSSLRLFSIHSR